ncbi:hypothetical protein L596_004780 [Steinernema carpocapsae]|uniref:C-type lectin domain-containing protein n=1 Tax=Steinernema carpocapsae TaxID=34508 RepID=A0A4U8UYG3_STECR|nr:hypothetical protein L596_004780 [Steinernema carpocapsae]
MNLDADWCAGSFACQRYYDGYLMSNLDDGHMPQLLDYMINYARYPRKVIQLHVGLQYHHDVKNYVWQGGFGVLNESQPERHRWCEGYPNRDHGNVVFSVLPRTGGKQCFKNEDHYDSFFWYFCQKRACDAKNYCP